MAISESDAARLLLCCCCCEEAGEADEEGAADEDDDDDVPPGVKDAEDAGMPFRLDNSWVTALVDDTDDDDDDDAEIDDAAIRLDTAANADEWD